MNIQPSVLCAGFKYHQGSGAGSIGYESEQSPTLTADYHNPAVLCMSGQMPNSMVSDEVCGTLTAHEARGGVDRMSEPAGFAQNTRDEVRLQGGDGSVCGALSANAGLKQTTYVAQDAVVRRLTPRECERLQGFPDDWTKVPYRGKTADECPDTQRYKAIGNSMAVPVMRWIGERIEAAERGEI